MEGARPHGLAIWHQETPGVQQVEVRGRDDLDLIAHFLMGWYRKNITRIQEKGGEWEENTNMGH